MCSRIRVERSRRGFGFDVGLPLGKMVRPMLATMLTIILVVSVVLTVVSPPTVSAVVPGFNGKVTFQSNRDAELYCEVYVMNADGSAQTRLTNNLADDWAPAWSPDGGKIAFTTNRDGNSEIYVMNADGSAQTRLTNNSADDDVPAWSPDGSKIAFQSNRDGNYEIYVMNANGSAQTNLTNNLANDWTAAWSPDATKIVFASDRDGALEIYVMNADGSAQTRLTNNSADDSFPAWSPDGRKIAFQSNRDGNWEVYVMNADGSSQTRLTNNAADDAHPDWQSLAGLASLMFFTELPEGSILMVIGDLMLNPHGSKPSGVGYQQGRDTTPLGYLRGMVNNIQPDLFDTNAAVNATTGRPSGDWPIIFSIGGPGINAVTHYYETISNASDQAPIRFGYNSTYFYWSFTKNGTKVPGSSILQSSTAVPPGTTDVFVIQVLRDADGRLIVLMYGTRYTGTWAAAEYFKFAVYPTIDSWTGSYYIVQWTDAASGTSANMMPDSGDTFTILAQGTP